MVQLVSSATLVSERNLSVLAVKFKKYLVLRFRRVQFSLVMFRIPETLAFVSFVMSSSFYME